MRRFLAATVACFVLQPALADCVTDAATYHGVNDSILRAILWNESSMKAGAVNKNQNGTVDVGIAQINSIHFAALRQQGVDPDHLMNACVGSYVAAWHLKKQVLRLGNTWQAVGAYHSMTPYFNQTYANRVHATLQKWKLAPPGPRPFEVAVLSPAPAAAAAATSPQRASQAISASPIVALTRD